MKKTLISSTPTSLTHSLTSNSYINSYDNLPLMIVRQCVSIPPRRTEHYKLCIDAEDSFDEYKDLEIPTKTRCLHFFHAIGYAKGHGRNSSPVEITTGRFTSYLEGAVHFAAIMWNSNDPLILSFDLSDEVFQTMMLPNGMVGVSTEEMSTSVLGGLLSLLCYEDAAPNQYCSIWIMKEYGVVDSWCKQFTVDLSGGITEVLGMRNNGHVLLEAKTTRDWVLSSYDPLNHQIKNSGIHVTGYHFVVDTYQENLVLLNKPNDAFSRRQVSRKRKDNFGDVKLFWNAMKTGKTKLDNLKDPMDSKHDLVDDTALKHEKESQTNTCMMHKHSRYTWLIFTK
ncbi:unnamed protein product [Camellia sinensis]